MQKNIVFLLFLSLLCTLSWFKKAIGVSVSDTIAVRYQHSNDFVIDAFPRTIISTDFRIPLEADSLIVVYPADAKQQVPVWRHALKERINLEVPFVEATSISEALLRSRYLVLLGSINNNGLLLRLYEQRRTFVDAYFPGEGGYVIHPVTSAWNRNLNGLVIGATDTKDLDKAFSMFLDHLLPDKRVIGAIRVLQTSLSIPSPPENVEATLQMSLDQSQFKGAPYGPIADWGLYYHLTGNTQWATHFKKAMYMLYERAQTTGRWIPEPWTNVYFNLWKLMLVWDNIDDDPFFTATDRKVIEEVLWGYTAFVNWLPNLDIDQTISGEIKQNHTTFLGLSLYFAHRYYTEKYQLEGLEAMAEKAHRCFEDGQANTFIPNDDAGGYLKYASLHTLTYLFSKADKSYVEKGHLANAAALSGVTFDNFGNQVSFGDVSIYTHTPRHQADANFFSMAASFYQDPEYQWMYQWLGGPSHFLIDRMYTGAYAKDMQASYANTFTGIKTIALDSVALAWFGRRTGNLYGGQLYSNDRYFHKMSFRNGFEAKDEYLLLDGLSGLSHGHHDGNSILRLTWKERIWLFDLDYFKLNTKFHNGVTVVRDGRQSDPPLLSRLDFVTETKDMGISRSTSQAYNGTDWERSIVWNKGRWFLVFDRIKALESGEYRLDGRWRTRGDVVLSSNVLKATQGEKSFFIKSADKASRHLEFEQDNVRSDWSDYPWGNGGTEVLVCLQKSYMHAGEDHVFANLLVASDNSEDPGYALLKVDDHLYKVSHQDEAVFIGLDCSWLAGAGVSTDAGMFWLDTNELHLIDGSYLHTGRVSLQDIPTHIFIDLRQGQVYDAGKKLLASLSKTDLISLKEGLSHRTARANAQYIYPLKTSGEVINFAVNPTGRLNLDGAVSGISNDDQGNFALGDANGKLLYFKNGNLHKEWETPAKEKITAVAVGDLDTDGTPEVVVGDAKGNLYGYGADGSLRWQHVLTSPHGVDFSAKDIVIGRIDATGEPTVLVGTGGWKVYAIRPNGDIRWECLTFYHQVTKVGIVEQSDSRFYVLAGTEYQTPLNVIDPEQGKVVYFTWEEMGSEFIAQTDYFGIHLTDMVSLDANGDGQQDVVFGTLSNHVYAVNADDGSRIWELNAGDEVTRLMTFKDPQSGAERLLVANIYGSLLLCDSAGRCLSRIELDHKITDVLVLPEARGRVDIVVATEKGIRIVDHRLVLCGAVSSDNHSYRKIFRVDHAGGNLHRFMAIGDRTVHYFEYEPMYLRRSSQY